ncbi:MAG: 6-hydroxymethylpterin diphosphokinase MptE-like protein, partial [Rhodospirillales bacterium]
MTGNKNRDLRARNLDLFRRGVPEIYARLLEVEHVADAATGAPPAERTYSARFTVKAPAREDLDPHTFHFLQGALRRATDAGIAFFAEPRSPDTYFLVVVGASHGGRLLALLERIRPLCVVVVEPDAGALRRSFDSIDWNAVFRAVRARKGELHFLLEDDADRVSANVWRVLRKTNPAAADGFTVVAHDHHDLARRIIRNLGDEAQLIVAGLGFFHDEMLMLANAYRNLGAANARVFKRTPDCDRGLPAFVIGSGPSLDWAIDAVKAHAGKAVVVSCGSAFRPLVKKGIVPDFQI